MTGAGKAGREGGTASRAGLVSIACPQEAFPIYAASDPDDRDRARLCRLFADLMADPRRNAVLIGPGRGFPPRRATAWRKRWNRVKRSVIDADAITAFAEHPASFSGVAEWSDAS